MLLCVFVMIQFLLDKYGIWKDDSYNVVEMIIYLELGILILIEDYYLLDDVFEEFEFEDYVGFQLYDLIFDLMEGIVMYIYVIIIEEVIVEDVSILIKIYRINIGNDKELVEVKVIKLFKFCCFKFIFDEYFGCYRSKEEVFDEIVNMLKQVWEFYVLEEERW